MYNLLIIILSIISINVSVAQKYNYRYASIKFNKANVRTGPSKDCPVEWVYVRKNEPIKIIAEYEDHWRKIIDSDGEGGWVHSSVLSGKRFVKVINKSPFFVLANHRSTQIGYLEKNIICSLIEHKGIWCKLRCKAYLGWTYSKNLWGV